MMPATGRRGTGYQLLSGSRHCDWPALSAGTPGVNRALVENNNHNIARVSVWLWDVFGTGKTPSAPASGSSISASA